MKTTTHFNRTKINATAAMLAAAACLLLVGPAAIADGATGSSSDRADGIAGRRVVSSFTIMPNGQGGASARTVEISMKDGRIDALVDGVRVDPQRVTVVDGVFRVTDEHGTVIEQMQLGRGDGARPPAEAVAAVLLERLTPRGAGARLDGAAIGAAPPRAILGVQASEPDEALRSHLGIEPGRTTIVSRVIDGLPAAEASLRMHDVIVAIDGRTPADPRSLHAAVAAAAPGDTIRFDVIRGGAPHVVVARLVPFDAKRADWRGGMFNIDMGRVPGQVELDVLRELDDRLWNKLFVVPELEPNARLWGTQPGARGQGGGAEAIGEDAPQPGVGRTRDMIFRSLGPPQGDLGALLGGSRSAERLSAIEARLDRLTEQLEAVLGRLSNDN